LPVLLDTSVAIELMSDAAEAMARAYQADALYLSVISHLELEAGVYRDPQLERLFRERLDRLLSKVEELDFTVGEVAAYSSIIAAIGFSRRLMVDRMIAATALANDLSLATFNSRDFRGIEGLRIEDWSS
jgi:tRNA(fMet)-specific endonuclease VapC